MSVDLKEVARQRIETLIIDSGQKVRSAAQAAAFMVAFRSTVIGILEELETDLRTASDAEQVP